MSHFATGHVAARRGRAERGQAQRGCEQQVVALEESPSESTSAWRVPTAWRYPLHSGWRRLRRTPPARDPSAPSAPASERRGRRPGRRRTALARWSLDRRCPDSRLPPSIRAREGTRRGSAIVASRARRARSRDPRTTRSARVHHRSAPASRRSGRCITSPVRLRAASRSRPPRAPAAPRRTRPRNPRRRRGARTHRADRGARSRSSSSATSRTVRASGQTWATRPVASGGWIHRHPAEGRLQADEPAKAGGNTDRAGPVGAERQRRQPGRDRGRAAAGRSARRARQIPGIARLAEERIVGRATPGEPGRLVRPTKIAPAARRPATLGASSGATKLCHEARAVRGALAGRPEIVLQRDRDAMERTQCPTGHHRLFRRARFPKSPLGVDQDVGTRRGFNCSMRSSTARVISTGEIARRRISSASSTADVEAEVGRVHASARRGGRPRSVER